MNYTIKLEGIKGFGLTFETGPRLLLSGDPQTGKSAVLDALSLAFLGHVPRLGLAPAELRGICGDGAVVQIATDEWNIGRRVLATPKSLAVSSRATIGRVIYETDGLAADAIARLAPDVLWCDFRSWGALTGSERKAAFLRHVPRAEDAPARAEMRDRMALEVSSALRPGKSKRPVENKEVVQYWGAWPAQAAALKLLYDAASPEAAVEALRERANTEAQQKIGAEKATAAVVRITAPESSLSLADAVAALEAVETEARDLAAAKKAAGKQARTALELDATVLRLTREIKELQVVDVAGLTAAAKQAASNLDATRTARPQALNAEPDYGPEIAAAQAEITTLLEWKRERQELIIAARTLEIGGEAEVECLSFGGLCPAAEAKRAEAEARGVELTAEITAAKTLYLAAKARLDELTRLQAIAVASGAEFRAALTAWEGARATAQQASYVADHALSQAQERVKGLPQRQTDLATAQTARQTIPDPTAIDEAAQAALQGRVVAAREVRDLAAQAEAARTVVSAGVAEAELAALAWKAAHKGAKAGLEAHVNARLEGIRSRLSAAVQALGIGENVTVELGRTLELNIIEHGVAVPFAGFSGAQSVLFAAALAVELQQSRPGIGLKVALIEAAECPTAYMERLLVYLGAAKLDLCVVASCQIPACLTVEGWTHRRMEPATRPALELTC